MFLFIVRRTVLRKSLIDFSSIPPAPRAMPTGKILGPATNRVSRAGMHGAILLLAALVTTTGCVAAKESQQEARVVPLRIVQADDIAPHILAATARSVTGGTSLIVNFGPFIHLPLGPKVFLHVAVLGPDGSVRFSTEKLVRTVHKANGHAPRTQIALSVPTAVAPDEVLAISVETAMPGAKQYTERLR